MLPLKIHRYIFLFSIILLGVSIPFSVFLMSVSQFLLATNWLLELDFSKKWKRIKQNKPALLLIGLFLLHLLWMINSDNLAYGWHDIKIKLPLFVLPILIGSSKKLVFTELKLILHFFLLAIVSSTLISGLIYFGVIQREWTDIRQISIFISHIRLSLLCNLGIFIAYFLWFKTYKRLFKSFYFISAVWLLFFLFILTAYTGMIIFIFAFGFLLVRLLFKHKSIWIKISVFAAILFISVTLTHTLISYYNRFSNFDTIPKKSELEKYTANGNPYQHNLKLLQSENGHYVYIYFCPIELKQEWNKRSSIPYDDGINAKGGKIRFTLFNYLTSMNLRKDSIGMAQLKEEDIKAIEDGCSNYIFKDKYSLYAKVYPMYSQIYYYVNFGYAEGGSLVQRFEYLKIAKRIIKENFWLGTGTGDVDDAFKEQYRNGQSSLSEEYQHRAHNQLVTFFISFGVIGFTFAFFLMFSAVYKERKYLLPLIFFIIALMSMLNEDTLETQAGVTFFSYFYVLFFIAFSFSDEHKKSINNIDA